MTARRSARARSTPWRMLLAGPVVAVAVLAAGCGQDAAPLSGFERTPTPNVSDLTLPAVESDGSEQSRAFQAGDDELLLVYFGFTSCPDVCPTTLADVRRAIDDLGEDGERVALAMVTIDPEVDTPEVLVGYVRSFVPDAMAFRTTDDDKLRAAATEFGADYGKELFDGKEEVYHTGSLYAVDPAGDLLVTWPFGVKASDLTADLDQLLDRLP